MPLERVAMIADSAGFGGWYPEAEIAAACELLLQSSLLASRFPELSCNSRIGFDSVPIRKNGGEESDGPSARRIRFFEPDPLMMRPPIRTFWFVPTCPRVEMFDKRVPDVSNS